MMAEECTHDCSSCGSACASRQKPQSLLAPANAGSRVKKVIGVVSGKGGVGKSLVTGLLACETARRGKIAGVLDADITGPSMPRILGIRDKAVGNELGILPQEAENGVKVMSINLLLEHDTDPVIWRGSLIAGTVKQFWTDVCWGDVDCLYVDMPPGTGDVPLTVFQSLPVDGIVTGCILAIGRIVGESAALLYTAGFGMALVSLFDSLHTSSATLTVALYVYATEGGETALAFSIATILMVLTLLINLTAGIIGRKLKRK